MSESATHFRKYFLKQIYLYHILLKGERMNITTEQFEEELIEFLKERGVVVTEKLEIHLTFEIYACPEIEINIKGFVR